MELTTIGTGNTSKKEEEGHLPVFGLPGYEFTLIHGVAVASLCVSILVSTYVLAYLVHPIKTLFKRPIGDRLVIYLAVCDLCFSVSHTLDHAYMLGARDHPPDGVCIYFAFLVNQFILTQAFMVIFTAINAFSMIILTKKIPIGKYDWRLMLYALGIPAVLGIIGTSTEQFGPSGAWCWIDMRRPLGPLLSNIAALFIAVAVLFNVFCYLWIWVKLRHVIKHQASTVSKHKYINSAKVMMLFVVAYVVQWWAYVAFAIWSQFEQPHLAMFVAAVFFGNFGGVFNYSAYTFIRKKHKKVENKEDDNSSKPTVDQIATIMTSASSSQ